MKNTELSKREIRVVKLLETIAHLEGLIKHYRQSGDESFLKGNLYEKNKFVKELNTVLKEEYNLDFRLEDAA